MMLVRQRFYSGASGLVLPVPRAEYPEAFRDKSRLHYYASLFNSIEINSSFYKLPMASTVAKWAESVGDDFRFTFKLSKTVSHAKGLEFNEDEVMAFVETVNHIGNKKGCILVQFPPGLKIEKFSGVEKLLQVIDEIDTGNEWKIAMEFRHTSWYIAEVYETLNYYKAAMVIQDIPVSATPLTGTKGAFKYLRFHGPEPRYSGSYSDEFLAEYAGHIKGWMKEGCEVYCYFNNTMGDAGKDLERMNMLISK